MSWNWSVFAIPAAEVGDLVGAEAHQELDDSRVVLGPVLGGLGKLPPWVAFAIEYDAYGQPYPATDDDLEESFFQVFSQLVSLEGNGHGDSVAITGYRNGMIAHNELVSTFVGDLLPYMERFGFDVAALCRWAGFCVNPPMLSGERYVFDEVPALEASRLAVQPISLVPKVELPGSVDELTAAVASGGLEDRMRLGIALIQSRTEVYAGFRLLDDLQSEQAYEDLADGPLKQATEAWVTLLRGEAW